MRHHRLFLGLSYSLALLGLATSPAIVDAKPKQLSPTEEKAASTAFKAGNALMEKGQYPKALVEFQKVLKLDPEDPSALWNAASAAQLSRNYKLAVTYFERDRKVEPYNGQTLAKLIQLYQALGDIPKRDARRTQIFAMHKSGRDDSGYSKRDRYCRDQFTVNGDKVFVFEYFDLKPRLERDGEYLFGVRYEFDVFAPDEENDGAKLRLEVGWNALEPNGKGGFRPKNDDVTCFYFDAYYTTGPYSRKTYDLLPKEISYEETKRKFLDIANGKAVMMSGRRRDDTGPGD